MINLSLVFSVFFLISCSATVQEYRIENENAKLNFLFSVEPSAFKDTVREKLIEKYRNSANIYVIDTGKLKGIQAENYNIILIMDTCMAGSPSGSAMKSFLKSQDDLSNIVLFITSGSPWSYRYKDLDAVTAATKSGDPEKAFEDVSGKIDEIIGK